MCVDGGGGLVWGGEEREIKIHGAWGGGGEGGQDFGTVELLMMWSTFEYYFVCKTTASVALAK